MEARGSASLALLPWNTVICGLRELLCNLNFQIKTVEEYKENNEVYSKRVKAGKRTYFFDVKATRANDYYLTITESRKKFKEDGHFYEKHKIFLYKEDLNKFIEALNDTAEHIKTELIPDYDFDHRDNEEHLSQNSSNDDNSPNATSGLE